MSDEKRNERLEPLKVYTLTEIEPILGCTHRTLLTYVKTGKLKAFKLGGKWKVTEETLREFIYGAADTNEQPEAEEAKTTE